MKPVSAVSQNRKAHLKEQTVTGHKTHKLRWTAERNPSCWVMFVCADQICFRPKRGNTFLLLPPDLPSGKKKEISLWLYLYLSSGSKSSFSEIKLITPWTLKANTGVFSHILRYFYGTVGERIKPPAVLGSNISLRPQSEASLRRQGGVCGLW